MNLQIYLYISLLNKIRYAVNQLGKMYQLFRSTLLYYDKIGLLKPSRLRWNLIGKSPWVNPRWLLQSLGITAEEIKSIKAWPKPNSPS